MGVAAVQETPSLTGEFVGETSRVLECIYTTLSWESAPEGPISLWIVGEVTESWLRAKQAVLFPL